MKNLVGFAAFVLATGLSVAACSSSSSSGTTTASPAGHSVSAPGTVSSSTASQPVIISSSTATAPATEQNSTETATTQAPTQRVTPSPSVTPSKVKPTATQSTPNSPANVFAPVIGIWKLGGTDQVLTITPNGQWSLIWNANGSKHLVAGVMYYVNSSVNFNGKVDYVIHKVSGGFFQGQALTFVLSRHGEQLALTALKVNGQPAADAEAFAR